jgi:hypothetical protein
MLGMLIAYDADGNVIATLDHLVALDDDGTPLGLADFDAHEQAGGEMTDVWTVEGAKGSKVWPEWLGSKAHHFRVELDGEPGHKRAVALVHRESSERRERAAVETAIAARLAAADGEPADIRDLVGGPDRPLRIDPEGRTLRTVRREHAVDDLALGGIDIGARRPGAGLITSSATDDAGPPAGNEP